MSKRLGLVGGLGLSIVGALALLSFDATVTPRKAEAAVGACNGATDDGPAINAALALHNGIVELNSGDCMTSVAINITPGVAAVSLSGLKGQGMFTTRLTPLPGFSAPNLVEVSGQADIRDMEMNGNGHNIFCMNNTTSTALQYAMAVFRVAFISCGVTSGGAIKNDAKSDYNIRDSYFLNDFWGVYNNDGGISSLVQGNFFAVTNGIMLADAIPADHDEGIEIKDNTIQIVGPSSSGIFIDDGLEIQIRGNTIGPIPSGVTGISMTGAKAATPVRVLNNWLEGFVASRGQLNEIGSNYFPNGDAILLDPTSGAGAGSMYDWDIHDNQFNSGGAGAGYGIQLTNITQAIVHHNQMEGAHGGFYSNQSVIGNLHDVLVHGNIFSAPCIKSSFPANNATFVHNNQGGGATCANSAAYPVTW